MDGFVDGFAFQSKVKLKEFSLANATVTAYEDLKFLQHETNITLLWWKSVYATEFDENNHVGHLHTRAAICRTK